MKLNLKQIKYASQCFRRFHNLNSEWVDERSEKARIAERVIQKCQNRAVETNFKPHWQTVVGWVDREVFKNVDVNNTEEWEAGRICSEQLLSFLNNWYKQSLLPQQVLAYSGLTLSINVAGVEIESTIPVIKITDPPIIFTVSNIDTTGWQLYNDIEVRGQQLLVARALEVDSVCYQRLTMGPRGGVEDKLIYASDKELNRAEKAVSDIARAIRQGANYPIVSERCDKCQFKRRCII